MRRSWIISLFITLILLVAVVGTPAVQAQEGQIQQNNLPVKPAQDLILFTSYPAQEAAIGEDVTFNLILRTTAAAPEMVRLDTQDLPEGWTASFRGGGRVVEAAFVDPSNDTKMDLRVEPPQEVKPDTYHFTVIAHGDTGDVKLPIDLTIKEKLPPSLNFKVDLPTLKGSPSTTFRYNATLKNESDADLSVNLVAEAPKGFEVNFQLSGQDVTSIPLAANESKSLSIEAKPFPDLPADSYQINVLAQGGDIQANTTLTADVTGESNLSVSAPDGRLSAQAYVGEKTPIKLVVQNTGSAPAQNIELSASSPAGWKVDFEPKQIAEVPNGQQVEVTANIQPADQAVAGDYVVTVQAKPDAGPSESADFRITVLTSTLWGIVGVGLIAIAVVVVGLAVVRFGRR
ncbi:MAG: hypothetical protein HYR94_17090 [Chloroflexi bacterium]|nr:hypothetical protein [Chloroflexota bacterium]